MAVNLNQSNLGDPIWYVAGVEDDVPTYFAALIIRVAGVQDAEVFVMPPAYTEIPPYVTTCMVFDNANYTGACRLRY